MTTATSDMTFTIPAASMILAFALAFASSTASAVTQQEIAETAKLLRTPADHANLKAFNQGFTELIAQQAAEVAASAEKMRALDAQQLYSNDSLVSATGIAKARSTLAAMAALAREDAASVGRRKQRADRYIEQTPLVPGIRSIFKDRFDQAMAVKMGKLEKSAAAQTEFLALLGSRLEFAEARLGQLSVNPDGYMAFANPQDAGEFNKIQEALGQAQMRLDESPGGSGR